jgi:hypothetical protein
MQALFAVGGAPLTGPFSKILHRPRYVFRNVPVFKDEHHCYRIESLRAMRRRCGRAGRALSAVLMEQLVQPTVVDER